jgi:rsbT co-antagonist protein RsbR
MAEIPLRMDEESRTLLTELLARHRDEMIALAGGDGERAMAERVLDAQSRAILTGDEAALDAFVEEVTTRWVESEDPTSTLLRGLLSFRGSLEAVLRQQGAVGRAALDVLAAADAVAHASVLRAADAYTTKLAGALLERRVESENALRQVAEGREQELDEMMRTLDRQHAMLNAATSPVIEVWEGILVVPLIGEIGPERASAIHEKVLGTVVAKRCHAVLVDITGLTSTDEQLAAEILKLVRSVRLLGADGMLVGVSARGALRLATLDVSLSELRSFATLHDGLRAALRGAGLRVVHM